MGGIMRNMSCVLLSALFLFIPMAALAGDLDSPAAPEDAASAMYTLEAIYDRLDAGTAGAPRTGAFTEPSAGPTAGTGHTLDEVMDKAPRVDAAGAGLADVLTGKTFWGLKTGGGWGLLTGTMPDKEGDNASTAQAQSGGVNFFTAPVGYYDGSDRVSATDAQVAALDSAISDGNIKSGVTIFGVDGSYSGSAEVPRTGQTECYNTAGTLDADCNEATSTGQDGYWADQGVGVAWPIPRFTDNGDGTVTDNLTGLIWLKVANYNSTTPTTGGAIWANALTFCNGLEDGECGLSDGSSAGDWRLPNLKELYSLLDFAFHSPALSNTAGTAKWTNDNAFTGVQTNDYWSSTTIARLSGSAWRVDLGNGNVNHDTKGGGSYFVWPVRGGQ